MRKFGVALSNEFTNIEPRGFQKITLKVDQQKELDKLIDLLNKFKSKIL